MELDVVQSCPPLLLFADACNQCAAAKRPLLHAGTLILGFPSTQNSESIKKPPWGLGDDGSVGRVLAAEACARNIGLSSTHLCAQLLQ